MRHAVVSAVGAILLVGCAQARQQGQPVDADVGQGGPDAKVWRDGAIEGPVDARPDSPTVLPPADAGCTNTMVQLLANPAFDLGTAGWVQQPIDAAAPLITSDDGIAEHSAPYKVWLGGLEAFDYGVATVTDVIYQDVTVPVGTTQLVLTGQYAVGTQETGASAVDTGSLALTQTNGTPIENVLSLSNLTPSAAWLPISKTFTTNLAGQTVRLRMTSSNSIFYVTNFFFDTFALTATVCQ